MFGLKKEGEVISDECRARKKLTYRYLEELVADRENAVFALRKELEKVLSCLHWRRKE